ncbi:MAG TPA: hypothetical protein VMW91_05960 [Desulfosporosinus sp.]|nr:hypothetical protein [Desulfosporosinus sp.]
MSDSRMIGLNEVAPSEVVEFVYHGKDRRVRVESIQIPKKGGKVIRGFDFNADAPVGGYRSFSFDKFDYPAEGVLCVFSEVKGIHG